MQEGEIISDYDPYEVKVGRPSKYKPEYCEQVLQLGAKGKSPAQIAAHFHITRQTLENWATNHSDFLAALRLSNVYSQAYWENVGHAGMNKTGFNGNHWKNIVSSRFRDDYAERRVNEIVGPNGGPLLVAEQKKIEVRLLAPEEREQLKQLLLSANSVQDSN
jgi:transposase